MDLAKSYDFFKPEECTETIHIIGCGSVGSTVAENLVRFGLKDIVLYDFDYVEARNIANQMFTSKDIGRLKVEALADMLAAINPDVTEDLQLMNEGWIGQKLYGYVFLCVDNIELRRKIAEENKGNPSIKGMFDFRTALTDAQHYAADWKKIDMVKSFINTMNFSHEEAKVEAPVSACNVELSVCPTIRIIVGLGVSNFINFLQGKPLKKVIIADAFGHKTTAF